MTFFEWSYVVEVCHKDDDPRADTARWSVIADFDTPEKASKYADECGRTPIRVRQFKVTVLNRELTPIVQRSHAPTTVRDMVDYACPTHPTEKAMGMSGGGEPTCSICRKPMLEGRPADIIDLTNG